MSIICLYEAFRTRISNPFGSRGVERQMLANYHADQFVGVDWDLVTQFNLKSENLELP